MKKLFLIFIAMMCLSSGGAWAQSTSCSGTGTCFNGVGMKGMCVNGTCQTGKGNGVCTSDSAYNITMPAAGAGLVATIVAQVKKSLAPLGQNMFQGIVSDTGFQQSAIAALTLYVIIYAVTFMFGMVQLTVYDFFIRMVKLCVVGALLNGTAWNLFSQTFVKFFNDGTDSIITQVSTIATGGIGLGGQPFDWIDQTIVELTSVKMLVMLLAASSTGPYAIIIMLLFAMGLYTLIKSMLNAMWVYLMALVMRTLLFGLAPLFLACVLFSRTRQLFDGWLNQLVNSCLQPIFLFTFYSFFIQLIKSCLDQAIGLNVCWTEVALWQDTPNEPHYWRFAIQDSSGAWVPFTGQWGFKGPEGALGPVNPVGVILPLTIWILSDLAKRFNEIVVWIAKDISNASTSFRFDGQLFSGANLTRGNPGGGGGSTGKVGGRTDPARLPGLGNRAPTGGGVGAPAGGRGAGSITTPTRPGRPADRATAMRDADRMRAEASAQTGTRTNPDGTKK